MVNIGPIGGRGHVLRESCTYLIGRDYDCVCVSTIMYVLCMYICMYVCICVCVCMYTCMYVCTFVCACMTTVLVALFSDSNITST